MFVMCTPASFAFILKIDERMNFPDAALPFDRHIRSNKNSRNFYLYSRTSRDVIRFKKGSSDD